LELPATVKVNAGAKVEIPVKAHRHAACTEALTLKVLGFGDPAKAPTVTIPANAGDGKLTLDAKRHLFLFYKEALHNIVKHSRATTVTVKLYDSRDQLVLEVSDNGVGLPRGKGDQMAAVKKLSDRARVLEGTLHVDSTPGAGTTLRLAVKRTNLMATKKTSHE
jgi:signal transduction histidine kinase